MICFLLMIHAIQRYILASALASPPAHIAASEVMVIFSCIKGSISAFDLRGSDVLLPIF
jgi:hypothetical protein